VIEDLNEIVNLDELIEWKKKTLFL
jgi:hypothetical protein